MEILILMGHRKIRCLSILQPNEQVPPKCCSPALQGYIPKTAPKACETEGVCAMTGNNCSLGRHILRRKNETAAYGSVYAVGASNSGEDASKVFCHWGQLSLHIQVSSSFSHNLVDMTIVICSQHQSVEDLQRSSGTCATDLSNTCPTGEYGEAGVSGWSDVGQANDQCHCGPSIRISGGCVHQVDAVSCWRLSSTLLE